MNVGVTCPECGTSTIVLPSSLYTAVGNLTGIEGELQFHDVTNSMVAETGHRLTVADVDRGYACPVCGKRGELPSEDELRRLAKEQGHPEA
jgi:hypothetical protein